jgi:hypothetical protein
LVFSPFNHLMRLVAWEDFIIHIILFRLLSFDGIRNSIESTLTKLPVRGVWFSVLFAAYERNWVWLVIDPHSEPYFILPFLW